MALVTKNFTLNVTPGAMPPTIHVSEYDVGRTYTITFLDENGSAFEIPTGTTATVEGTLNGTVGFTTSATISNNQITFALTESMTAYAGYAWCKIKLTQNSQPIQTCAFVLAVDRAGVEAETVIGAPGFEEQIRDAAEDWLEEQGFQSPTIGVTQITGGHRVTVTDYQHTDSFDVMDGEDGDTVAIDTTLTHSGEAADAKATGDRLAALETAQIETDDTLEVSGAAADAAAVGDALKFSETTQITANMWNASAKTSSGSSEVWQVDTDPKGKTAAFNVPTNQKITISVSGGHNRFAVLGSTDYIDTSTESNVQGLTKFVFDNSLSEFSFDSGEYQSIFVYLVLNDTSLSPQVTVSARKEGARIKDVLLEALTNIDDTQESIDEIYDKLGAYLAGGGKDVAISSTLMAGFDRTGTLSSSSRTRCAVYKCLPNRDYRVSNSVADEDDWVLIGDFAKTPAVGDTPTNYKTWIVKSGTDESFPGSYIFHTSASAKYLLAGVGLLDDVSAFKVELLGQDGEDSEYSIAIVKETDLSGETEWEVNGIDQATGYNLDAADRIRTKGFYRIHVGDKISVPNASYRWYLYSARNAASFVKSSGSTFLQDDVVFQDDGYLRLSAVYSGEQISALITGAKIHSEIKPIQAITELYNNETQHSEDVNVNVGEPYFYLSDEVENEDLSSKQTSDVFSIYDALCANYPDYIVRMNDIGQDSLGNGIRRYRIRWQKPWMSYSEGSTTQNDYDEMYDYRKLLLISGTHGDEKVSVFGMAYSIQEIVTSQEPWANYVRSNFILDVIPIVNPSGFNAGNRNNSNGVNLNRDFIAQTQLETQSVVHLVESENYHSSIDSHNTIGRVCYIGTHATNPQMSSYIQIATKLASMFYYDWKTFMGSIFTEPHLQFFPAQHQGLFQQYLSSVGLSGVLVESPRENSNPSKFCKLAKDLIINLVIALGRATGLH